MATTADIRNGLTINYNNGIYSIVEFLHVKPGKGPAFVRTKLKNVQTGKVISNTFTAGVRLDVVRVERRSYQFLYKDDMGYNFMNNETFEQVPLPEDLIPSKELLQEGMNVEILFHAADETPLTMELPPYVVYEVVYTEPGLKGDTATNTLKPAKIDTGATINVPLFINEGDKIKVDTRTGEYSERVKE